MSWSRSCKLLMIATIGSLCFATSAAAQNRLIPFQGKLTNADGSSLADANYDITFKIWTDPTGTGAGSATQWSELHTIFVRGGQVNVILGSKDSLDDPNADGNQNDAINFATAYLGITVGNAPEMQPRQQLIPSFQARLAEQAKTVATSAITTSAIQTGAVTTATIGDGEVKNSDLGSSAVTSDKSRTAKSAMPTWRQTRLPAARFSMAR